MYAYVLQYTDQIQITTTVLALQVLIVHFCVYLVTGQIQITTTVLALQVLVVHFCAYLVAGSFSFFGFFFLFGMLS
jgi:uncharacterized membrane protein YGL010W